MREQKDSSQSVFPMLRRLWGHISDKGTRSLSWSVAMAMVRSFLEFMMLILLYPLVNELTQGSEKPALPLTAKIMEFGQIPKFQAVQLLGLTCLAVIISYNLLGLVSRYLLQYSISKEVSHACVRQVRFFVARDYVEVLSQNSLEIMRRLIGDTRLAFQTCLMPSIQVLSGIVSMTLIFTGMLMVNFKATLVMFVVVGGGFLSLYFAFRRFIDSLSKDMLKGRQGLAKVMGRPLMNQAQVRLSNSLSYWLEEVSKAATFFATNNVSRMMLAEGPRYIAELVTFVPLLGAMLYYAKEGAYGGEFFATLGVFIFGTYRIIPSLNMVYASTVSVKTSLDSVNYYLELMDEVVDFEKSYHSPKEKLNELPPFKSLSLENVSFSYPNVDRPVLEDLSLTIHSGETLGIVGGTGAGKTTLMHLLLGLLHPTKGKILYNGEQPLSDVFWGSVVGYIPQDIVLLDDSIICNVAFGIPEELVDVDQVWKSLERAQMADFVRELPDKLNTRVGERGSMLSGGQRQRVAIARALYHNPQVLFLDEATSALDNQTEKAVMESVYALSEDCTVIIIAHRLDTIRHCDRVVMLDDGKIVGDSDFTTLLDICPEFLALTRILEK